MLGLVLGLPLGLLVSILRVTVVLLVSHWLLLLRRRRRRRLGSLLLRRRQRLYVIIRWWRGLPLRCLLNRLLSGRGLRVLAWAAASIILRSVIIAF